jgi:hypothetical protein
MEISDMTKEKLLLRLGEEEEELEAACAALASLLEPGDELGSMAAEHRRAASMLLGERPRMRALLSSMRAVFTAMVRNEARALAWLRDREHQLVRSYLALDCREDLDEATRQLVRRTLLPAAFERFTRIDRVLAERPGDAATAF